MKLSPQSSIIALGTSNLRSVNGGLSNHDAVRLLQRAFEAGVSVIDTASSYGQGDAERTIGEALHSVRDQIAICTKVGLRAPPNTVLLARLTKPILRRASRTSAGQKLLRGARHHLATPSATPTLDLIPSVHRSLKRLRTDHVDVLYLHNPGSPETSPIAESVAGALEKGLCRAVGVAVADTDQALAWLETNLVTVVQIPVGIQVCRPIEELDLNHKRPSSAARCSQEANTSIQHG
jgi:pyridoxine 4-dehydrogenase